MNNRSELIKNLTEDQIRTIIRHFNLDPNSSSQSKREKLNALLEHLCDYGSIHGKITLMGDGDQRVAVELTRK